MKPLIEPAAQELMACPDCDLLHRRVALPSKGVARCRRCGTLFYRNPPRMLEQALALSVTGLILFILANLFPLLALELSGRHEELTLIQGTLVFVDQGQWMLAVLVFLTSLLFPLLRLLGLLYVLLPLHLRRSPPLLGPMFRLTQAFSPWSMAEIFLLGALVAAVKLGDMASILPGAAAYAFAGLILTSAWIGFKLEPQLIWDRVPVSPHG